MAKKGEHKKTKPTTPNSKLSPMGKWRRENKKKNDAWRKRYKQTDKSKARNKARRLLEKSGRAKKCTTCGGTHNLEVHHKDSNPMNNSLSNLSWKCSKHNPRGGRTPAKKS